MNRAEEITEVKVYSNQPEVTLYVDSVETDTQRGQRVFTFHVSITGGHTIRAAAGNCEDSIAIRRVEKPDSAYQFAQEGGIVNWFDKEDFNPDCFSIKDTMGELLAHPQAGQIVGRLMAQASASRGDVAKSAGNNANLQKMMSGMSLQSLLKQAGDAVTPEQVKQLNTALQKIPRKG